MRSDSPGRQECLPHLDKNLGLVPRKAVRIVLDTGHRLAAKANLFGPRKETPVLMAVGAESSPANRLRLSNAGCEVFVCNGLTPAERLDALLLELGHRRLTNVLVEGAGRLLGSLLDVVR